VTVTRSSAQRVGGLALLVGGAAAAVAVRRQRLSDVASQLQARGLARRAIREESEVRRRVAEAIHDGPVQELIGLDMVLSAVGQAIERDDREQASELIREARKLAERNVRSLRDEIIELGPHAFEEVSYESAVEHCVDVWHRRYGLDVRLALERIDLPAEIAGDLFRITQEAVINAGRHAEAKVVSISLRSLDGDLELRVVDDGQGFGDIDPLGSQESGHLGLASIRERAELMDGTLEIETSERGTKLLVVAPLTPRRRRSRRARLGR
jgi:two-component system, NarL family, sensor histidine kinase DegS